MQSCSYKQNAKVVGMQGACVLNRPLKVNVDIRKKRHRKKRKRDILRLIKLIMMWRVQNHARQERVKTIRSRL